MKSILTITLILGLSITSFAQRCDKKFFCDKSDLEDFDFRSQSSFAVLSPGDTANLKLVVYAKQNYRILLGTDPILGDVQMTIYKERKEYEKYIKEIQEIQPEPEYKVDEYGNYEYDDYGDWIEIEQAPVKDTVWAQRPKMVKEILFDNYESDTGLNYWDKTFKKSQSILVKVAVPEGDSNMEGCVNLLVGRRTATYKGFQRHKAGDQGW